MTATTTAPAATSKGYDSWELDKWREQGFTLTDQTSWLLIRPKPRVLPVLAFLLLRLFLPLGAATMVRLSGWMYLDAYRPRHTTDEVVTQPTADEVVRYERESGRMLRSMLWVMVGHAVVSFAANQTLDGLGASTWIQVLVLIWLLVSLVQGLRFLFAADHLADTIRLLHRDFHSEDPARFPYAQHRSTFPKV